MFGARIARKCKLMKCCRFKFPKKKKKKKKGNGVTAHELFSEFKKKKKLYLEFHFALGILTPNSVNPFYEETIENCFLWIFDDVIYFFAIVFFLYIFVFVFVCLEVNIQGFVYILYS